MSDKRTERRGLGRGLSALMADVQPEPVAEGNTGAGQRIVPIEQLTPNPDQPRKFFDEDDLRALSRSIKEKGIIQPLIVREIEGKSKTYEIVAGERRWRAAQMAQLHDLPVIVREFSDQEVLEIAIIENIQRADLSPVDEALGYQSLIDRFGHTQEALAQALSVSRSHIANTLRLLNLPDEVKNYLNQGVISAGHARAALASVDPVRLIRQVINGKLSVREAEELAKQGRPKKTAASEKARAKAQKDADTAALEKEISATLGMKVSIDHTDGGESGKLTVRYGTLMDLDKLCALLSADYRDG